jgi:hypothetical protein
VRLREAHESDGEAVVEKQRIGRRDVLKRVGAAGAVSVIAAVAAPQVAQAQTDEEAEDRESSKALVGSWRETIDAGGGFVFDTLITFDSGGGLVATASIDSTVSSDNLLSGPTHGAWVKTKGRSYRWFGNAFSFNNSGGAWDGTYEIKEALTLNESGDRFEGGGTFRIVGGTHPLDWTPYTTKGTRIKA